eukprot:377328_1
MSETENTAKTDNQLSQTNISSPSNSTQESKYDDTNESEAAKAFNSKTLKERLKIIFSNDAYKKTLPFIILWVIAGYMPAVFFVAWGAEQYTGCSAHTAVDESENECIFDYNGYNKTASWFNSAGGLMAFMFGGLIGRISDSYGRKPIFYVNLFLSASLYIPLVIFPNIWLNLALRIPAGLNSSDNSFTPMMMAYMSD